MRLKNVLVLAASLAAVSTTANAAVTSLKFTGVGLGDSVKIVNPVGTATDLFAGQLNMQLIGGPANLPTQFVSNCVDLGHGINTNDVWSVSINPLPNNGLLANSGRIAYLYDQEASVTTNDQAAGLQLAIWSVLYGSGFGVTTAPTGAITAQTAYLTDSVGKSGSANLFISTAGDKQNQVGPPAVPEPSSLSFLGACALPLMGMLRRKK